jgi:hypothetical protein
MKSESEVHRDLDTIRRILIPLDDAGREGVLASIIMWWAMHHEDRVAAITRLFDRIAEMEEDFAIEEYMQ